MRRKFVQLTRERGNGLSRYHSARRHSVYLAVGIVSLSLIQNLEMCRYNCWLSNSMVWILMAWTVTCPEICIGDVAGTMLLLLESFVVVFVRTFLPIHMWLCIKWRDMVHGCMVHTERAQTACSSFTWHQPGKPKQRGKYTTSVDTRNIIP